MGRKSRTLGEQEIMQAVETAIRDHFQENGSFYNGPATEIYLRTRALLKSESTPLRNELEGLRAFQRGVNAALNSGDGSYRP